MKTDQEVVADKDDAEMMKRRHLWPQNVLPLKRNLNGGIETAVLPLPPPPGAPWLLLEGTTMFNVRAGRPVEYESPEAIVAAGWIVD